MIQSLPQTLKHKDISCSIDSQDNPISAIKRFATKNCVMCAEKEQQFQNNMDPIHNFFIVDSKNKWCGTCTHNATDVSIDEERVNPVHKVETKVDQCNICPKDVSLKISHDRRFVRTIPTISD